MDRTNHDTHSKGFLREMHSLQNSEYVSIHARAAFLIWAYLISISIKKITITALHIFFLTDKYKGDRGCVIPG